MNHRYQLAPVDIVSVINQLLPIAEQGLQQLHVAETDIKQYLAIIERRVTKKMTGAIWQKNYHRYLQQQLTPARANQKLVLDYISLCRTCQCVDTWEQPWL